VWAGEQETGVALRALHDEPAPPTTTTLEEIVRRGRRRVRGQRLGVLAVVAVVLAAGAGGALALWSPDPEPAPEATELTTTYPWPEQLPGWSVIEPARCRAAGSGLPIDSVPILPRESVEPTFVAAVTDAVGWPAVKTASVWDQKGYTEVEIPLGAALGSVHLEAIVATRTPPVAAADADVWAYGFCSEPLRRFLANGAVLQLYPPDVRSPFAPVQHLRVYQPAGQVYVVSSAGWSRADNKGGVVRTGRGRLPLDSGQLADVAERIAELK
jgi:hypothetical protein